MTMSSNENWISPVKTYPKRKTISFPNNCLKMTRRREITYNTLLSKETFVLHIRTG